MKSLKGLSLISWLLGTLATCAFGDYAYFAGGLFLGIALFGLSEAIESLFGIEV